MSAAAEPATFTVTFGYTNVAYNERRKDDKVAFGLPDDVWASLSPELRCGFCFVEYYTHADAENAMRYVNSTKLDDRIIRTDWDARFVEGHQFGHGKSGGQVRDE
ncbi:hypothetical protein MRX96_059038 [Rhipicephalus microplus]